MRSLSEIFKEFTEIIDILIEAAMAEADEELINRIDTVEQELYNYVLKEEKTMEN